MSKNIFILIFMVIFLLSCQTGKEDAKKFSDEYIKVTEDLRVKRSEVKTRDEYAAYKEETKKACEDLLKKYEKSPAIEEIEILRSKVLLKLNKPDEAEKKIDDVLAGKPDLITEAKMVKVQILLEREKFAEAYDIFKDIEPQVKDVYDLFGTYYSLGTQHEDNKVKEKYAKKFLDSKQIPEDFMKRKYQLYFTLASIAKQEGDFDKAGSIFKEGLAGLENEQQKAFLQKSLEQLDYYGGKAFSFSAGTWINSSPLGLDKLKNQVIILYFWAPWCPSCRALLPYMLDIYNENKDKGFTLIGFTRIYGSYSDDLADKGKMGKDEEIENIKSYLERHKVTYPVAISDDKTAQDSYKISALPTLVFIDRKGAIEFTKIGGGNIQFVKDKIKKLLEEV